MDGLTTPDFFDKWRRFVAWLGDHGGDLAIASAFALAVVLVLIGLRGLIRRMLGGEAAVGRFRVAEGVVARTYLFFFVMVAAKLVTLQFALPDRIDQLVDILFVIAAALQIAIWARALILGAIERRIGTSEEHGTLGTAINLIRVLVTVAAFLIAIIVILDNVGVNVTGLIAGLGIGGIAIGLAAQGIFKDLFAALSIVFDRPFRRGDTVAIGGASGVTGTVEDIGLRTTRLRALDGEQVSIGNDKLLQERVHNYALQQRRRAILTYSLPPHASADAIGSLLDQLAEVVKAQPQVTFDRVNLVKLGAASADIEIAFHMETPLFAAFAATRQVILLEAQRRAAALGIAPAPASPAPAG